MKHTTEPTKIYDENFFATSDSIYQKQIQKILKKLEKNKQDRVFSPRYIRTDFTKYYSPR